VAITKEEMIELSELVAQSVVKALIDKGLVSANSKVNSGGNGATNFKDKSAYWKTEQLLWKYRGFQKLVEEKRQEIVELREFGVPQKSKSIVAYSPGSGTVQGTVLPEESVESAVCKLECAIQSTVQVISMVDTALETIKNDPYYEIIPMRYFDGCTMEDIGVYFNCNHSTISRNNRRLINELALRLFTDEVVGEYLGKDLVMPMGD
jgi:hypothetical protein